MKPHVNRLVARLARRARSLVWPTLARNYRKDPAKSSNFTLKLLGIADTSYRPAFAVLANAVDNIANFEGDIIECGVFRGSTLLGVAHRLACRGIRNVKLIGCDSFQGFPAPSQEDALEDGSFHERALQGSFSDTDYNALCSRIAALGFASQINILKGFFEETLPRLQDTRFSIVHLDCDLYQSYRTCLNFLYPRLLPGGYMVFDEYDHSAPVYPGARKAIDEFLADRPEKLQRFGQGEDQRCYLIKL
jgi:Macrocin-O-methyltransferase (TylF)